MTAGRKLITTKKDWNTPPKYVEAINEFFENAVNLDPCSNENSTVNAEIEYSLPTDGMKESWDFKKIYVNPPYGKGHTYNMFDWLTKGKETSETFDSEILYLIPVAPNTKHFKEVIFKAKGGLCFLADTRLKFWSDGEEMPKGAPMACCMVYFGKDFERFNKVFTKYGKCFEL